MIFYTYLWLRDDGTPYYVGKGRGNRAFCKQGHYCPVPPRDRVLIEHHESEDAALKAEMVLIAFYGRKDLGTGCLLNLTPGGDAPPSQRGRKPTQRQRDVARAQGKQNASSGLLRRIGLANCSQGGRTVSDVKRAHLAKVALLNKGRKHTEESRRKMSEALQAAHARNPKWRKRVLTVGYIGNFTVSYCTECDIAWTLEKLGHKVIRFQENQTTTDQILHGTLDNKCDLVLWTHTHGWNTPGTRTVEQLIQELKPWTKTAGFHLDLYWGLNYSDRRQDRIGQHPFWHCDYVFTADGSHQDEFKARGVNHHWLPPAVVERGCFKGNFDATLATDVAFVGSRSYHSEYPFRERLIAWLEQTYGRKFRRINGDQPGGVLREARLNNFYASARVVVGDCCFSGMPKYWSDRAPETIGRGGFLIHPKVDGLNIPGLVTFEPQNFSDLRSKIDYYLDPANEAERIARRDEATAWVWKHETYTQRVQEMLRIMELN